MIVTPVALLYTEYRIEVAWHHLLFAPVMLGLGILLGVFYVLWFSWNVFGSQHFVVRDGEIGIESRMLVALFPRRYAIGDIVSIQYHVAGYRGANAIRMELRGRSIPASFGENLTSDEAQMVLEAIAKGIPMLAGKIHRQD